MKCRECFPEDTLDEVPGRPTEKEGKELEEQ